MTQYADRTEAIAKTPRLKELWSHHVAEMTASHRMQSVGAVAAELAVRDLKLERGVNAFVGQIERFAHELGFFSTAKVMDETDALVALQDMADYIRDAKKVL